MTAMEMLPFILMAAVFSDRFLEMIPDPVL